MLVIINSLKEIFSLEEIKAIFDPVMFEPGGRDAEKVGELYLQYMNVFRSAVTSWADTATESVKQTAKAAEAFGAEQGMEKDEKNQLQNFMSVLMLMSQSAAIKKAIRLVIEENSSEEGN